MDEDIDNMEGNKEVEATGDQSAKPVLHSINNSQRKKSGPRGAKGPKSLADGKENKELSWLVGPT